MQVRIRAQNGTEKDSKGLRWNIKGKAKGNREGHKWPWEKTFEGIKEDGTGMVNGQERKQKREFHGEKGMAALFLLVRRHERRKLTYGLFGHSNRVALLSTLYLNVI